MRCGFTGVETNIRRWRLTRFTRAVFGLAPSPFLLGGVTEAHLSNWEEREPEIVAKIRRELYVDDLQISGSTTVHKSQELKDKAINIFQDACFKLHKWHSNVRELESAQTSTEEPTFAKQQLGVSQGGRLESSWPRVEQGTGHNEHYCTNGEGSVDQARYLS